jgi:Domain of unknown function (DUF4395)
VRTLGELFSFPNPVNETSARVVAAGVVAMAAGTIALDQPWLLAPLTYGFAARVAAGPRFSPLGLVATKLVTPRLAVDHRFAPGAPKRLAQAMGLTMTTTASLLAASGARRAAYRVLALLVVAAGLEALFGICLACKLFPLLVRARLVPASVCEECADLPGWDPRR